MDSALFTLAIPMIIPPPSVCPLPIGDVTRVPVPVGLPPLGFSPAALLGGGEEFVIPDDTFNPGLLVFWFSPGLGWGILISASPRRTRRQVFSPVVGSLYCLRSKRMWFVFSSCSIEIG